MQVFLIHRFSARDDAFAQLRMIEAKASIFLNPIALNSSRGGDWKAVALAKMKGCEMVIIFDLASCMQSENAVWEIDNARKLKKPLVMLAPDAVDVNEIEKLRARYHHDEEFQSYFQPMGENTAALYKMMVDSSEQLVQRRQTMNAFFITAIGSLIAITGAFAQVSDFKAAPLPFLVITVFGLVGLLLCYSWRNLIDNYGKLNAGKFRVILQLEQSLSAQIFSAEWAALGKGQRPKKYRSFTTTENVIPVYFAFLFASLIVISIYRYAFMG